MELGKPLNTHEGLKEALLFTQGVIPGKIIKDDVRDFMLSQVEPQRRLKVNQAR